MSEIKQVTDWIDAAGQERSVRNGLHRNRIRSNPLDATTASACIMKRYFILSHAVARQNAIKCVSDAPEGMIVEVKEPTRNLEQNAKLWAMLSDVARQVDWYGRKLSAEDWKHVFTASLSKQDVVPGIDGGFVVLGKSTSSMSKRDFAELIELIFAFGAERGVLFVEVLDPEPFNVKRLK